ncbi:MAG: response regulator transcription factor [Bdellovibrionales bacterium]
MHILIVSDQVHQFEKLRRYFISETFSCTGLHDVDALDAAMSTADFAEPDLILLFRYLGPFDATKKLKVIFNKWPNIRVVLLSPTGDHKEKAKWIDSGVEDYLITPVEPDELIARVRRILKRGALLTQAGLPNWVSVDDEIQDVLIKGERLKLSHMEFLLGKVLFEHPTRVFSKPKLLDMVWDISSEIESNVVEVTISHLRHKLDKSNSGLAIRSRRNQGYWLEVMPTAGWDKPDGHNFPP